MSCPALIPTNSIETFKSFLQKLRNPHTVSWLIEIKLQPKKQPLPMPKPICYLLYHCVTIEGFQSEKISPSFLSKLYIFRILIYF